MLLACLPMDDLEENGAMVNAMQRRADVIVQKRLAEGFGLTVAKAMWKARPVLASRVGGIQDQIIQGRSGLLLDDPSDLAAFGRATATLLEDRERAERPGRAAGPSGPPPRAPRLPRTAAVELPSSVAPDG